MLHLSAIKLLLLTDIFDQESTGENGSAAIVAPKLADG